MQSSVAERSDLAPERYRRLVELVPDHAIVICDRDGRVTDFNRAAEAITGHRAEDVLGRPLAWLHARAHAGERGPVAAAGADPGFAEWRRRADGERYWCEGSRFSLLDDAGRVVGSAECFRDASRAKAAEDGLRASEARFATTLRSAPILVSNQDVGLRYTWAPMGIPGLRDGPPAALLGRTDDELLPAGEAEPMTAIKRAVLGSGERARTEIALGDAYFDVTVEPIHADDGAVAGLACVAFDITQLKRVEEDLRSSRARLMEAERLARIGSWEWDIPANHVAWSDGLYAIYGIDPSDFDPRYEPGSQRLHPDDRERVDAVVQRALETGNAIDVEYRIVRPDGRIRRVHGRAEVIFDERGRPLRLAGTAQDVTEVRAAEDALEETAAELARRAAELHSVTRFGAAPPTGVEHLITPRQLEILRLIAEGHSNVEIADRLYVTEGTVKWHVRKILKALGVSNRAQAVARLLATDPGRPA